MQLWDWKVADGKYRWLCWACDFVTGCVLSPKRRQVGIGTVVGVHDDATGLDAEIADEIELEEYEAELDDQDLNGQVISIRRANGDEILTIVAEDDEWNVDLQPGGAVQAAFLGSRRDTPVWVNALDHQIERDDDGTYVIRID